MTRKIRILIVEDQPPLRELLRDALSQCPSLEVVDAVGNAHDAIRTALETHPEVVLTDIELGEEMTGIDAARQIERARPGTGVVILSSHKDREYVRTVVEVCGWSYLLKSSVGNKDIIVRAIEGSAWGYVTIDPALIDDSGPRDGSGRETEVAPHMIVVRGSPSLNMA
ncbi:MAG: response regulator transcription factor [Chloroflexi bacterium]|nr:response regulator transcription factor [Chloroflexota bacterium]